MSLLNWWVFGSKSLLTRRMYLPTVHWWVCFHDDFLVERGGDLYLLRAPPEKNLTPIPPLPPTAHPTPEAWTSGPAYC